MRIVNKEGMYIIASEKGNVIAKFTTEEEAENYMKLYSATKGYSSNNKNKSQSKAMEIFKKKING